MTNQKIHSEESGAASQEPRRQPDKNVDAASFTVPPCNSYAPLTTQAPAQEEDSWILTYIDILTLLLTLFVVLLYLAKTDAEKFQQLTSKIGLQMGAAPIHSNIIPPFDTGLPVRQAVRSNEKNDIETLGEQLLANVKKQGLDQSMAVMVSKSQVELRINENILFASGEAELLPLGVDLITKVAALLGQEGSSISVEGHTDSLPISTARFPSNWELSAARASMVVRELILHGIPAQRLRAVGYADTHPITDNLTAERRAQNRRVSLLIQMEQTATTPDKVKRP